MLAGSLLVIVWLLGQALFAESQATNATCSADHQWAFNSQKQSPCAVASSLLAVCTGTYTVYSLPEQNQYMGPDSQQDANPCWCNTVVYSLLSECALCQNRTITMWSIWEVNCPSGTVSIESFPLPLPSGLHVPGWAYLPVKASDMFNESLAESVSNTTKESTAISQPSRTASLSTSTSLAATTTPASSLSNASSVNQRQNAIGGGIVGGICGLTLVSILGLWIYRLRRNAKTKGQMLNSPDMTEHRLPDATLPSQSSVLPVPSITVSTLESQASASIRSAQMV